MLRSLLLAASLLGLLSLGIGCTPPAGGGAPSSVTTPSE